MGENPTSSRYDLNESLLDCGKIVKKIPMNEIAAITPRKLKVEDDSPEASFSCNFEYCAKSFTCASALVSHLQNHYTPQEIKIDCPFDGCRFSNTRESLTSHMRARHTGETLFSCEICLKKFHTMAAKVVHDRKHSRLIFGHNAPGRTAVSSTRLQRGTVGVVEESNHSRKVYVSFSLLMLKFSCI